MRCSNPLAGSGTTLIAAETTGRVCFGIELNPTYVDVAIERWQSFTSANAVLADTGETFADLKPRGSQHEQDSSSSSRLQPALTKLPPSPAR